ALVREVALAKVAFARAVERQVQIASRAIGQVRLRLMRREAVEERHVARRLPAAPTGGRSTRVGDVRPRARGSRSRSCSRRSPRAPTGSTTRTNPIPAGCPDAA